MSNHEINVAVAKKRFGKECVRVLGTTIVKIIDYTVDPNIQDIVEVTKIGYYNPCDGWKYVGTILVENKLVIDWVDDECFVSEGIMPPHDVYTYNENPCRAICEVYLMMDVE